MAGSDPQTEQPTMDPGGVPVLPGVRAGEVSGAGESSDVALLGNPNTGKTTLFNRLTGLRQKTANYPGTTIEQHIGVVAGDGRRRLMDLPGVYSIEQDSAEAAVCRAALDGRLAPGVVCVIVDASALRQGLRFLGEIVRRRLPTVVALTMLDLAQRRGVTIDADALAQRLGCPVVATNPRSGAGVSALRDAFAAAAVARTTPPADEAGFREWIDALHEASAPGDAGVDAPDRVSDRLDWAFTHPVLGAGLFAAIMLGLFWLLFRIAVAPMDWIEAAFAAGADVTARVLPPGLAHDLIVEGVIPGLAGALVFLPQICLLFFLLSILEDTGYLARAAFVADRLLRRFGLPGAAFIPLLSSHACAIPGILAARSIPNRRERLATILVAPFMTCSARLPVYALLVSLLFADRPSLAALAFAGCYALGAAAGVVSALVARGTILRGASAPMSLELPSYKAPSMRTALLAAYDRGMVFLRKAGVFIFMFSIVLWWFSNFPASDAPAEAVGLRERAAAVAEIDASAAAEFEDGARRAEARATLAGSFAGRVGRALEPVFEPLGFDWRVNIGVLTSFAAREVFVSTLAIVFTGDQADAETEGVIDAARSAVRDDGVTPVFTRDAAWAMLVFYVLAMQCFSTLVVTAREAGGMRWAVLQFLWMSGAAYVGAWTARMIALAVAG